MEVAMEMELEVSFEAQELEKKLSKRPEATIDRPCRRFRDARSYVQYLEKLEKVCGTRRFEEICAETQE